MPVLSDKKRILFFSEAVTLAHFSRPFVLAHSLDSSEFDIHFACSAYRKHMLEPAPSHWQGIYSLDSISAERFLDNVGQLRPIFDHKTLQKYVEEDLLLINKIKPDLIIGDLRLSLIASAELTHTPYAVITNAYWSPYAQIRILIAEYPFVKLVGHRLAQTLFDCLLPIISAYHSLPINIVRAKYGLMPIPFNMWHVQTYADYVLYADIPSHTLLNKQPDNQYFLGPLLWNPPCQLPKWWNDLPADKPIAYLTLGSSGDATIIPMIISALADMPINVMFATANRSDLAVLPSNFYAASYLPGIECAARANVVICNGGSGTTQQALAAGVPMLAVVYDNLDQLMNMEGILRHNVGMMLRHSEINANAIAQCVSKLLNDETIKASAQALKKEFAKWDASANFVDIVRKIIAQKN